MALQGPDVGVPPVRTRSDHQQAVFFIERTAIIGKSQDRGAQGFHHFAILP